MEELEIKGDSVCFIEKEYGDMNITDCERCRIEGNLVPPIVQNCKDIDVLGKVNLNPDYARSIILMLTGDDSTRGNYLPLPKALDKIKDVLEATKDLLEKYLQREGDLNMLL